MGILDSLLGKGSKDMDWTPTTRAMLKELTYDEITSVLGRPKKAQGGFVYWRGSLSDLDPDYPEDVCYQLSNKDYRGFGDGAKKPRIDREYWFLVASDPVAIRLVAGEVGGLARNIEEV